MRTKIEKYDLSGPAPVRVDPIALKPTDFVEEWLSMRWAAAMRFSDGPDVRAMLDDLAPSREFGDVYRCDTGAVRWVVSLGAEPRYFYLREVAPHAFRLHSISRKAPAGCGEYTEPDDPTLFPTARN
jgi:hypothetical protein